MKPYSPASIATMTSWRHPCNSSDAEILSWVFENLQQEADRLLEFTVSFLLDLRHRYKEATIFQEWHIGGFQSLKILYVNGDDRSICYWCRLSIAVEY